MTLIELLETKDEALNAQQVAELLGVSKKQVYHLAASEVLPSFRIDKAIQFDPQDLAEWLRKKKRLDEQPGLGKVREGQRRVSLERNSKMLSPDHVWRKKTHSLEAALRIDGLSGGSSVAVPAGFDREEVSETESGAKL